MGDGINDAPSMRVADVGISVDTAVDVAKESADIILLEKSLLVLEDGIIEGRKVFNNIVKYIRMGASSNFGNMFSMVGSSYFLQVPARCSPMQMLINNLLYDALPDRHPVGQCGPGISADPAQMGYRQYPPVHDLHRADEFDLRLRDVFPDALFLSIAMSFQVPHGRSRTTTALRSSSFHTGWFVESILTQTMIVHIIRTRRIPFFQSIASPFLLFTTVVIMAIGALSAVLAVGRTIWAWCRCRPSSGSSCRSSFSVTPSSPIP